MPTTINTTLDVHDQDRAEQITARLAEILTVEFGLTDPHLALDLFPAPQPVLPVPQGHDSHGEPDVIGLCPNPDCAVAMEWVSLRTWEYSEHDFHPDRGPCDSDYSHTYAELLCCRSCGTPILLPDSPDTTTLDQETHA